MPRRSGSEVAEFGLFAGGMNGSGVSIGTLFGKYLAKLVSKQPADLALLAAEGTVNSLGPDQRFPSILATCHKNVSAVSQKTVERAGIQNLHVPASPNVRGVSVCA
jgi:hypothetical protein